MEEHYVSKHVTEILTLLVSRCESRSADLREIATRGRLNPDHSTMAKAEAMTRLRDQLNELTNVRDSASAIAALGYEEFATQLAGEVFGGVPLTEPVTLPFKIVTPPGEAAAPEAPAA